MGANSWWLRQISWQSAPHLGKIGFASSRRPVQQQPTPGLPLASEELRKLDWQDDSFLQGILGCLQPSNIVPLHSIDSSELCSEICKALTAALSSNEAL